MRKRTTVLICLTVAAAVLAVVIRPDRKLRGAGPRPVKLLRVPDGGLQPQAAVDSRSVLHLIYFKGDPAHGDIMYVRSSDWGSHFSAPVRVNSQPGSALALGSIRGARLALGMDSRVFVAWNGSTEAQPKAPLNPAMSADSPYNGTPMLFARLNDSGSGFDPQRNLMQTTFGLDGGGSVAADSSGDVYVAWHAKQAGAPEGEEGRRVWIARSTDDGAHFAPEAPADADPRGACGCCGLSIFADKRGDLYTLYRTAHQNVHRDIDLLLSTDRGVSFRGRTVDPWDLAACPMSSMSLAQGPAFVDIAWQTKTQVYYAMLQPGTLQMSAPVPAPGAGTLRKYPALAVNAQGDTLLAWTDGTGWGQGGSLAWQVFDRQGRPSGDAGSVRELPPWSFAAAFGRPDGGFTIIY